MKPRELTAALSAVVGATCVVAFAVVYLFSPELPLGPMPQGPAPTALRQAYGPPEPPPSTGPAVVVQGDEADERAPETTEASSSENRWRPDVVASVPAKVVPARPKKAPKKKAARTPARSAVVAAAPVEKVSPPVSKKEEATATKLEEVTAAEPLPLTTQPVVAAESIETIATPPKIEAIATPKEIEASALSEKIETVPVVEATPAVEAVPTPETVASVESDDGSDERFVGLTGAVSAPAEAPALLASAPAVSLDEEAAPVAASEATASPVESTASPAVETVAGPELVVPSEAAVEASASASTIESARAPEILKEAPPANVALNVSDAGPRAAAVVESATSVVADVAAVAASAAQAVSSPVTGAVAEAVVPSVETTEPIVVTAPVVEAPAEAPVSAPSAAEPELAGGADVAEAIAANALDLPSEDEGAVDRLTAADIEAERWLSSEISAGGYPGAADAGTIWSESGAPGNAAVMAELAATTPDLPENLPEEIDTVPSVALLQPTDFSDLQHKLAELTAKVDTLPTVRPFVYVAPKEEAPSIATAPEPELVVAKTEPEPVVKTAAELQAEWANEAEAPAAPPVRTRVREALAADTELRPENENVELEAAVRRQVAEDTDALEALPSVTRLASAAPSARRAAEATQTIGRVANGPKPVLDAREAFAAIQSNPSAMTAPTVPASTAVAGPSVAAAPAASAPVASTGEPTLVAANTSDTSADDATDFRVARETIFGQLKFGKAVETWLEAKRGHVELYLQPENTRDPSDTIYVDYHFPDRDFRIERGGLVGRYRLVAGIFAPSSPVAVAQIPYAKLLSEENYKERVRFYLDDTSFERALAGTAAGLAKSVALHLTLYSAGTSNYQGRGADGDGSFRQPTPIGGGTVRIVGAGDVAPATSDAEGNARFARVPSRSDLLVEVTAPGFLKTYAVVPVADGPTYQPVYLVAKDKVETITTYFTRRPQQNGHAVVMGRAFDTDKRRPQAGQKVRLQNRKGPALYFGALPDTQLDATTKNGLFGFFNVAPSFRSIAREARDAVPYLLHLRPNTGTYVELGRGGSRALVGRLYDPFAKKPVVGSVRLVGSETVKVETDDRGNFRLDDLEFPPGIVTIEVDADGYPLTWINVSWSPREPEKTRTFFLVADKTVGESMHEFTKVSPRADRGSIVGGAESELFKKTQGCLTVTLESLEYGAAKTLQGPHPLLPSQRGGPLCVSAATPGFTFHDLPAGEWNLRWTDSHGQTLRMRVVRVGQGRVSVVVN